MTESKTKGKATVVAKLTRADGTEETFVSEDVTVTDVSALSKMLDGLKKKGDDQ